MKELEATASTRDYNGNAKEGDIVSCTKKSPRSKGGKKKKFNDIMFEKLVKALQDVQGEIRELYKQGNGSSSYKLCKTNMTFSFMELG